MTFGSESKQRIPCYTEPIGNNEAKIVFQLRHGNLPPGSPDEWSEVAEKFREDHNLERIRIYYEVRLAPAAQVVIYDLSQTDPSTIKF